MPMYGYTAKMLLRIALLLTHADIEYTGKGTIMPMESKGPQLDNVCPRLTGIQWEQQHCPDSQCDSHDDDNLREPGLVFVLGMHVVHQHI